MSDEEVRDVDAHGPERAAEEGADLEGLAARWSSEIGRHVFVTLGERGIVAADAGEAARVPGVHVDPPIDIVGAGDTCLASIAMALGAGATPAEAARGMALLTMLAG